MVTATERYVRLKITHILLYVSAVSVMVLARLYRYGCMAHFTPNFTRYFGNPGCGCNRSMRVDRKGVQISWNEAPPFIFGVPDNITDKVRQIGQFWEAVLVTLPFNFRTMPCNYFTKLYTWHCYLSCFTRLYFFAVK